MATGPIEDAMKTRALIEFGGCAMTAMPNYQAEMTTSTMLRRRVTLSIVKVMNDP
jgi:hypothetical protein